MCSLTLLFVGGLFAAGAVGHALLAALTGSAGIVATARTAGNRGGTLLILLAVLLLAVLRLAILLLTILLLAVLLLPILLLTILCRFIRHGLVGLRAVLRLCPITAGIGITTVGATFIARLRPLSIALVRRRACRFIGGDIPVQCSGFVLASGVGTLHLWQITAGGRTGGFAGGHLVVVRLGAFVAALYLAVFCSAGLAGDAVAGALGGQNAGLGGDYGRLNTPSVWRTNRTQAAAKVDGMASAGMDDIEIPAFLRKQAD